MTDVSPPLSELDQLLAQARNALLGGDPAAAGGLAERAARLRADHPEAHHLMGRASLELGLLGRALEHLQRAASLNPKSAPYTVWFASALARASRTAEAIQVANIANALADADTPTLLVLGSVYMQCHVFERANAVFRRAAALAPDHAAARFNFGVTSTFMGKVDLAQSEFEACLELQPDAWRAYGLRSRLRRQTAHDNHLAQLQARLADQPDNEMAQQELHSALGKEYEDLGDIAKAFEHYRSSKHVGAERRNYNSTEDQARVDAMIRAYPARKPQPNGYPSNEPIFVVGMPRSGTTLVERILSSHPDVHSAGELPNFGMQVERLAGTPAADMLSPALIDRCHQLDWERLGLRYVDSTRPQTANKPRFIDKLPHNFLYVGFIANALPNARIICLRRDPMDTCLSNFRELFAANSPFHRYSFDLLDIGRFYIQFERMMTHWRHVLPERVLEVDYEALVAEQEVTSRRLLAHCDLPWDDACLKFDQNRAAVATASTVQVREPIYRSSIGRWKAYGALLEPLERLLNDAGINTRT